MKRKTFDFFPGLKKTLTINCFHAKQVPHVFLLSILAFKLLYAIRAGMAKRPKFG
jgi:hypothetical protein